MTNFSNSLQCQIVISDQFKLMATLTCICSVSSDIDMKKLEVFKGFQIWVRYYICILLSLTVQTIRNIIILKCYNNYE